LSAKPDLERFVVLLSWTDLQHGLSLPIVPIRHVRVQKLYHTWPRN
jgi:hypothetical protein